MTCKTNYHIGSFKVSKQIYRFTSVVKIVGLYDRMIQNYKCNEIKIKCSEFFHTTDATFLKIRSALSCIHCEMFS